MRCPSCPVDAGRPCLGETTRFGAFCGMAASGDPVKRAHVVGRSAIAERGPSGEATGEFPSLFQQARNLAGAVAAAVASGLEPAPPEERERRLAICRECEHFTGTRCRKCGCVARWKVKLAAWHCPIDKF
jgi:hypothetical protein